MVQATCLMGITARGGVLVPAAVATRLERTIRLSSGKHEPQVVPHLSVPCSDASRASSVAKDPAPLLPKLMPWLKLVKCSSIAASVTFRQVQTSLPRFFIESATAAGGFAPGKSSKRP